MLTPAEKQYGIGMHECAHYWQIYYGRLAVSHISYNGFITLTRNYQGGIKYDIFAAAERDFNYVVKSCQGQSIRGKKKALTIVEFQHKPVKVVSNIS